MKRVVAIVVAVVAYFIASSKGQGAQAIMNLVENAWAGFGSAFGSVVILSVFWRRFTYKGALAGVISGALTDVIWFMLFNTTFEGIFNVNTVVCDTGIYELIPGFIVSMIVSVVATLLDKAPSKEVCDIYDAAVALKNE